jgi:hypothetical protein
VNKSALRNPAVAMVSVVGLAAAGAMLAKAAMEIAESTHPAENPFDLDLEDWEV